MTRLTLRKLNYFITVIVVVVVIVKLVVVAVAVVELAISVVIVVAVQKHVVGGSSRTRIYEGCPCTSRL